MMFLCFMWNSSANHFQHHQLCKAAKQARPVSLLGRPENPAAAAAAALVACLLSPGSWSMLYHDMEIQSLETVTDSNWEASFIIECFSWNLPFLTRNRCKLQVLLSSLRFVDLFRSFQISLWNSLFNSNMPPQWSGHFTQLHPTKLKVRVLAWNAWNVSPVNPVSFFLKLPGNRPRSGTAAYISIPNLSVPGWLLSRRLWISEKFEETFEEKFEAILLSTPSWRRKKTSSSWWFGRNRIEIPRALKVVLVNPNYSKLVVKHFIATWQYHGTQNFETFWDFMNGFGRKKTPEKIRSFTASVMSFSMTFKSASCCANKREAFLLGISNGQHSTSPNHWLGVVFVYQADLLVSLTSHHYEKEICWVKVLQLPSIGHLIF